MAYEQKDMSGSLFKNQRKEKDTHPDATGSCMIDGVAYWMNAWTKQDKNGNRYQSFAFKRKDAPPAQRADNFGTSARVMPKRADMDDEIPFLMEWR